MWFCLNLIDCYKPIISVYILDLTGWFFEIVKCEKCEIVYIIVSRHILK